MAFDFSSGDACSDIRATSGDATKIYRNVLDTESKIANPVETAKKGDNFTTLAETYLRSAVRHTEHDSAAVKMLMEGSEVGRGQKNDGAGHGYDGIQDALRLARENGATGQRIDKIEACATVVGKSIFGKDYELPHKRKD